MQLHLAEAPQVESADGTKLPLAPRDAAMLAWLALEGPTPRDQLAALLWPASSQAHALTALRQRLFQLKKALGADVATGSRQLQLNPAFSHDLAQATELLGSLTLPDAPELDAWLQRQRQQRRSQEQDALRTQAQAQEDAGEVAAALPVAQAILRLDPLSEAAHQRVMRLHYLLGDRAAALQAFDTCERMLKDEIGTRPSPQTLALLATVEAAAPLAHSQLRPLLPASVMRPPRLVGRDRELQAARQAWQRGQVISVTGEAGIGKSRLLQELRLAEPGTVLAQARPGDAVVPYAALGRLLSAVRDAAPQSASLSPRYQWLPEAGSQFAAPPGPAAVAKAAVAMLCEAGRVGVRGLVLDDLHFADEASVELLQSLCCGDAPAGMHLGFAARPAEGHAAVARLHDALLEGERLAPVELGVLSAAQMQELVASLGLDGVDNTALAAQLHQHTGGNPLFALETLRQGLVEPGFGQHGLPRPVSVARLIERRLARLSPQAVMLARCAAVAMPDFSIELAEFALEQPALQLADAWRELEQAQVLRDSAFAHDLVFDAVLQGVPEPIARLTHARVAHFLAREQREPARIAEHWLLADRPLDALPWLLAAAQAAGQAQRSKERCEFLMRAAVIEEAHGSRERAFELALRVTGDELHIFLPDPMQIAEVLERLADDDSQRSMALGQHAWLEGRRWNLVQASALAQQSLECAQRTGDLLLINDARHRLAVFAAMAGRPDEALPWFELIQDSLRTNSVAAPEDFHANHALALDNMGRVREAWQVWQRCLKQRRTTDTDTHVMFSNVAIDRQLAGHFQTARDFAMESLRVLTRDEAPLAHRATALITLARCEQGMGRWRSALAYLHEIPQDESGTYRQARLSVKVRRCEIWLDLGQFARAMAPLAAVAADAGAHFKFAVTALCELARARRWQGLPADDGLDRASRLLPLGAHADLHLRILLERCRLAAPDTVARSTDRILSEAQALGLDSMVLAALSVRVERLRDVAPALAADAAQRALQMSRTIDALGLYKPELWWHAASALAAAGDHDSADDCASQACTWIRERVQLCEVPPEFVDSFLHRNPVNRSLLAWPAGAATLHIGRQV